jgi:hypothetical protein
MSTLPVLLLPDKQAPTPANPAAWVEFEASYALDGAGEVLRSFALELPLVTYPSRARYGLDLDDPRLLDPAGVKSATAGELMSIVRPLLAEFEIHAAHLIGRLRDEIDDPRPLAAQLRLLYDLRREVQFPSANVDLTDGGPLTGMRFWHCGAGSPHPSMGCITSAETVAEPWRSALEGLRRWDTEMCDFVARAYGALSALANSR